MFSYNISDMSKIKLTLIENQGSRDIVFTVRQLFCGGFTGRNQEVVRQHIKEMASVGISPPEKTPAVYHISPYLITYDNEIEVVGENTSGEVEPVLLIGSKETYLTVGSDQTDRNIERLSYPKSKQLCNKIISRQVWRYSEVQDHYDELIIRSIVVKNGQKYLYQEGSVKTVMNPHDLLQLCDIKIENMILFAGTIPTKTNRLIFADWYQIELIDPILNRIITHTYNVKVI